jgi:hypothetical protein
VRLEELKIERGSTYSARPSRPTEAAERHARLDGERVDSRRRRRRTGSRQHGPKISSRAMRIELSTSANTVGATYQPVANGGLSRR